MISTEDQEELFKLIADYLERDITCLAIGGTAMMFAGYKNATKDIDLVFMSEPDRNTFIKAIEKLGYKGQSLVGIYDEKRTRHADKPKMYTRGDERFDLFTRNVFGFGISIQKDRVTRRHDFLGKKELIIYMPTKEDLILLKAITRREKDHEDILTIIHIEKTIDWSVVIDEAIKQRKSNPWILIDLEETMQELKRTTFIPNAHFQKIYKAQLKQLST